MLRARFTALLAVVVSSIAVVSAFSEPAPQGGAPSGAEADLPKVEPTPMVVELLAVVEEERVLLDELRTAISGAADPTRRLELERRIETVKRETELALLGIQLDYALREHRPEVAVYLHQAIEQLTAPPVRMEPAWRPAPERTLEGGKAGS